MTFAFPELPRPQYPSSPEVLLSALAWSVVPRDAEHKNTGLIYHRQVSKATRRVRIEQTMPQGDSLRLFGTALASSGLQAATGELPDFVPAAVADALLGVQPPKGVGTPSSAIGLCGALLQDPVGGLAVENPPNFARLLNTMHRLGGVEGATAAERWFLAALHHASNPRLKAIEAALAATTLRGYLAGPWPPQAAAQLVGSEAGPVPSWWQDEVISARIGTPFSWFRTSWDRLCSPKWYNVLPPRRWAGWAVCVLRNALGFGFLWESNFYYELARGIVDPALHPMTVAQRALRPTKPLVPYQKGGVAQMDVMPSIKQLLGKGLACRKAVVDACMGLGATPGSIAGLVEALRSKLPEGKVLGIRAALGGAGEKGGLPNLIETVRYSLLARGTPEAQDHNSLLRVVSRNYTHVVPGPEWIVVMSAMSTDGPSVPVRLGDVRQSLDDLGFKPRIDFLLSELERAGLCASAPDGDEGIEINLGFSGT